MPHIIPSIHHVIPAEAGIQRGRVNHDCHDGEMMRMIPSPLTQAKGDGIIGHHSVPLLMSFRAERGIFGDGVEILHSATLRSE